jgi:anti-sigma factor RsiW
MSCPRLEQSVFLHAHGQLPGIRGWMVESHLQRCTVCRARWAQWTVERDQFRRALAPMPADPVGFTGLTAAVGARIRAERAVPVETPAPPRPAPAMVAFALTTVSLAVGISAFAAFWQPSGDHCASPAQLQAPVLPAANTPGNCPGHLHPPGANQPEEKGRAPAGPVP